MEIYLVIVEDRHTDTMVYPFTDMEKAISEARRIAHDYCRHPDYYQEYDYGKDDGWVFYAKYGESDCVRVVKSELDHGI